MSTTAIALRFAIEELVYRSCLALDGADFEGYLALSRPEFRYTVRAFSPEIRHDMVWMDLDKGGMETLFHTLPRHNSDLAPLGRHATVYTVTVDEAREEATVVTALQVIRTELDGGQSQLFAAGKIHDTVALGGGVPLLRTRMIRLDTRQLGIGSHIPL